MLHWWSAEPHRLSDTATRAIEQADELVVNGITWYELAWLATHDRIAIAVPVATWLDRLSAQVRTVGVTPAVAATAARLPASFPGDPADRLIYATAVENGWRLVSKDRRLREHPHPGDPVLW